MKCSEARKRAVRKYDDTHTKQFPFKLNIGTDKELIWWLSHQKNRNGYLKELVRQDILHRIDERAVERDIAAHRHRYVYDESDGSYAIVDEWGDEIVHGCDRKDARYKWFIVNLSRQYGD